MNVRREVLILVALVVVCLFVRFPLLKDSLSTVASPIPAPFTTSDGALSINGTSIYHKKYRPTNGEATVAVLLLHGAAFSSQTWEDIGTLNCLAEYGCLAVAVDLPGFGRSKGVQVNNRVEFLKSLVDSIDQKIVVVISPSMSGSYSIPYINHYGHEIDGYVPVAPVSVSVLDVPKNVRRKLKVLAVVGEKDTSAVANLDVFRAVFINYRQLIIPNGTHPAYLTNPELFNRKLISFVTEFS